MKKVWIREARKEGGVRQRNSEEAGFTKEEEEEKKKDKELG